MKQELGDVITKLERAQILASRAEGGDDPRLMRSLSEIRDDLGGLRDSIPDPVIEIPAEVAPVAELPTVAEPVEPTVQ